MGSEGLFGFDIQHMSISCLTLDVFQPGNMKLQMDHDFGVTLKSYIFVEIGILSLDRSAIIPSLSALSL